MAFVPCNIPGRCCRCAQTSSAPGFCDQDQGFHGGLPLWRLVLSLLRDVGPGILQGHKLPAAGQRDRIVELRFHPRSAFTLSPETLVTTALR
jgi:hypothetical protein